MKEPSAAVWINCEMKWCHSLVIKGSILISGSVTLSLFITPSVVQQLSCPEHKEVYTIVIYHACNIDYQANTVIISVDTDSVAILGHMHHLQHESHLWVLSGTGNKDM